jgi:Zn-dependent protease with chaperone function
MERKSSFPGISPSAWEHPSDRAALAAFTSLPLAGDLIRRVFGSTTERSLRLASLANSARATESQFSSLRAILVEMARRLDLDPVPELFVRLDPTPDISTFGVDSPFVVVTSGALELWDDEEMAAIMGHEVGHVLSGHAIYKTLLALVLKASSIIAGSLPLGGAAIAAVSAALHEWDRKSELSADRASLLATQDSPAVFRALMKSAAGKSVGQMDLNEFFRQGMEYEGAREGIDSLYKFLDILGETHPFPVARMTALQEWEKGGSYAAILRGEYPRRGAEGERDPKRDFENAKASYAEEFSSSSDPLAQAAAKVMDTLGGLFGSIGRPGNRGAEEGGESGQGGGGNRPPIEELMDKILGKKKP